MVVCMAPELEEAKQLAGARSVVLDRKAAGHRLSVFAVASCCSKTCLVHRSLGAQSRYAVAMDGELHHWSVGLDHSRLVAVHTDSNVPVQAAHERERSSVVHKTRNATVRLSQVEVTGVAGYYLSNWQVEIYYGHLTLKDVFVPRWFVYYGLHDLPIPSLPSCYRTSGKHCLAESFLVCWQPHAFWPSPSLSTLPLRFSWGPVAVAAPDEIHHLIAAEAAVDLGDL